MLAAGMSTRMGRPKATLPLGGETFVGRIVKTFRAADVEEVVVVLGGGASSLEAALRDEGVDARLIVNPDFERGQFSSVLAGLRAIDRPGILAMLLTLVDQRTSHSRDVVKVVRSSLADQVNVFNTEVRLHVALKETAKAGRSILDYDSNSPSADAYRNLAREVLASVADAFWSTACVS